MQRRDFLRILLGTAIAEAVDVEQLLWIPKTIVTVPALPFVMEFPNGSKIFFGIPYHMTDASMGQWLGIKRQ